MSNNMLGGIYMPSRPLKFRLNDPNVTSNIVQTLSTLTSEVATTKKKLQGTEVLASKALSVANKETNGVPQSLWSLDVTQTAQIKASYTNDFISCSFTYNTKDPNFGFVRIYVTGMNGGTEPVEVASGSTSPITFDLDATGQTVTITAQVVSDGGVAQPFADAVTASLTLNGFSSAMGGLTAGYGPLGWTPVYNSTYINNASINIGSTYYNYSGMDTGYGSGLLNSNYAYFYNRFTGYLIPPTTGEYTIGLNSDDGANLYICGQQVGTDNLATSRAMASNLNYSSGSSASVLLNAGTYYPIVVEWQNRLAPWGLQLLWTPPGGSTQLIPNTSLSSVTTSINGDLNLQVWQGTSGYWWPNGTGYIDPANKTLFGPPANGGGTNVVNSVITSTKHLDTGGSAGNSFTSPGWIVGQIWSAGSQICIILPSASTINQGYIFNFAMNGGGGNLCYIESYSGSSGATGATQTTATNYTSYATGSTVTGWWNFAIYIGANGYMAAWVNNNLVADCTDTTYALGTPTIYYCQQNGWADTFKIAPAPNGSGAGSTALNPQGSIATISDYTFSYTSTSSTITWSWSAFDVYCPDGSSYSVAASTGSATTHSGASGTLTGTTPLEWTGLTASTTYNFTPYVTLNANGTATVSILCTGTSAPTLAQMVQVANGDGNVPCSNSVYVTAATPSSGSGGGSGGGGSHSCFSPSTKVKTQRGDVAFADLIPEQDEVLTARGTWRPITVLISKNYIGPMLDMGNGELSTLTHFVLDGTWKQMQDLNTFPTVHYRGTIHNIYIETEEDDDGTALDTEHSYTLANGLVVHNVQT